MDRRSWPWKKKSSDKAEKVVAVLPDAAAVALVSQGDDQESYKKPSYIQISFEQYSHLSGLEEKVKTCEDQLKEFEEQVSTMEDEIKDLNEKLTAAHAENTTKEELVKQHSKVAEEAVSGWEKAETEALALKTQLESVTLSKLTVEDRASHLDGALKECMRQIRNLKEEHEHKLQDVMLSKTKQLDKIKLEFEEKMAIFEQELLRSGAENDALSRSLQDRSNMLIKMSEEKSQAEADIEILKSNVESCEREINSLKYELHVNTKELEIRNEEKNMSMRSAEVANKQHMEGVKKITKLEAECQRLRGLVRKKLPGPAALAMMKQEVESLGRDYGETRPKRSPVKSSSPHLSPVPHTSAVPEFALDNVHKFHKENEFLTERLLGMEEETKMLKEALAKRNSELQASRNLCAKTASRLQGLEAQLQNKSPKFGVELAAEIYSNQNASNPPSLTSMSEDGNDDARSCAESWSTTLCSDVSHVKKNKSAEKLNKSDSVNQLELMDDFLEMEKLACLPNESNTNASVNIKENSNDKKLENTNNLSHESRESDVDQASVLRLQSRILKVLESVSKETDAEKILEAIRQAVQDVQCLSSQPSVGSDAACDVHANPEDAGFSVEKEITLSQDVMSETEIVPAVSQEVVTAISKIHSFLLFLGKEARAVHDTSSDSSVFDKKIEEFSDTYNKVVASKKSLVDFIFDVSQILEEASELKINVIGFHSTEVDIHSPDCIDKVALPENKGTQKDSSDEMYPDGCSDVPNSSCDPEFPDDGNVVSGYEPDTAVCKFTLKEFEELKSEKDNIELEYARCVKDLDATKSQLHETEQFLTEVKSQLASAQNSNSLAETQLKCMAESYKLLETRAEDLEADVNLLQGKVESLVNELGNEKRSYSVAIARCTELEEELQRNKSCLVCSKAAEEADLKAKQEKELAAAAEKLAECQETIFLLGKQFKALRPQEDQIQTNPQNETTQKDEDEPTTTTTQDIYQSHQTEMHTPPHGSAQKRGSESPNFYNSQSDNNESNFLLQSPSSPKNPKHRYTKSSSSTNQTPEKGTRGFSRFFSSKGKNSH